MNHVQSDETVKNIAKQPIEEIAQEVKQEILAKEFPRCSTHSGYYSPKLSDCDRKIFKNHEKVHVMMLLPWMEMGGADLFNLDVCRKIDKSRFEVSILTTVPGEQSWRQRFEEYVTDIFDLHS